MRTGRLCAAALAVVLALGGCSDDESTGHVTTASTAGPSTTEVSANETTAPPAVTDATETSSAPSTDAMPVEGRGLLVNVTTDDTWSANMAFSLATNAAGQGLDVIVFLNVRGVYLADAERMPATEGTSDQNLHEKIAALVDAGAKVIVCPSCAMEAGLTQDDLVDGAVIGEPGGILPVLADPNYHVISYTEPTEN
ncbi:MAG: DsrE family protein [Ilumatobacteraceae bacterium]|nr:DsrE family protein [Acidimicrobiales bacterium]MCB9393416.1 DsrE family protein [Acidimicrobiaceae bacterium]